MTTKERYFSGFLMLWPALLLGYQLVLLPPLASTIGYFPAALFLTLMPVVFRSKRNHIGYWLLWLVLLGVSVYSTFVIILLSGLAELLTRDWHQGK